MASSSAGASSAGASASALASSSAASLAFASNSAIFCAFIASFFCARLSFFASSFAWSSSEDSLASFANSETLSDSWAPCEIQWSNLSTLNLILSSDPFAEGLKKPKRSMNAPSLGFLESATVMK